MRKRHAKQPALVGHACREKVTATTGKKHRDRTTTTRAKEKTELRFETVNETKEKQIHSIRRLVTETEQEGERYTWQKPECKLRGKQKSIKNRRRYFVQGAHY
jgi:hypothetical protein